MKYFSWLIFLVAGTFWVPALSAQSSTSVFVHVNVVPMDVERVLSDQTVIVEDGRITAIGPSDKTRVPDGAMSINGAGKFLMPGLVEMHAHIPHPNLPKQYIEDLLFLFVANGVTTVRGSFGIDGQLAIKERANKGEIDAPSMYLAGPGFSGYPRFGNLKTAEQAELQVRKQKSEGWDYLKVLPGLSGEAYEAMVRTAKEVGMPFFGHVPTDVGLMRALEAGQETIEHLDGYVDYVKGNTGPLDEAALQEAVRKTREAGTWMSPTMAWHEVSRGGKDLKTLTGRPELKYMPPQIVDMWVMRQQERLNRPQFSRTLADQIVENRKRILKTLYEGGVPVLLGTDAPQGFNVPGFSSHREMMKMVEAGMPVFEVIKSGTHNPGIYFKDKDNFGTIEVGKRADLILVDDNPLQDVSNISRICGVMIRGSWLTQADIQARLEDIEERMLQVKLDDSELTP